MIQRADLGGTVSQTEQYSVLKKEGRGPACQTLTGCLPGKVTREKLSTMVVIASKKTSAATWSKTKQIPKKERRKERKKGRKKERKEGRKEGREREGERGRERLNRGTCRAPSFCLDSLTVATEIFFPIPDPGFTLAQITFDRIEWIAFHGTFGK